MLKENIFKKKTKSTIKIKITLYIMQPHNLGLTKCGDIVQRWTAALHKQES